MTYIAPQTFREWHPIGIIKSINKQKIQPFNIGNLPMILWFYNNSKPNPMINICRHLGNNLNNGHVTNNCLVCPFHKQKYNQTDNFGSIIESDGLYWWSYKSNHKKPLTLSLSLSLSSKPLYNYYIDINTDLITFILNFISMNIENDNDKHQKYYYNKNKKQLLINRILFKYPYTIIVNNYRLSILPLSYSKLRIYVTTYNPMIMMITYVYMIYIKNLFENQIKTNDLKKFFLFTRNDKNGYLEDIYKLFNDYMFLTDFTVNQFIINRNFY